jgi:hypothetical protein
MAVSVDRDRLIKLLNMTASQHDAEVLVAIRKSNALLRRNGTTWSDLLGTAAPPSFEDPAADYQIRPEEDDFREFDFAHASDARGLWEARVRANAFKAEIRAVPFWLRLLFFPLWAGAEVVATAVVPERNSVMRGSGIAVALMVFLLCSGVYLAVLVQLFMS